MDRPECFDYVEEYTRRLHEDPVGGCGSKTMDIFSFH